MIWWVYAYSDYQSWINQCTITPYSVSVCLCVCVSVLTNFEVNNILQLTVVTMLYLGFPGLALSCNWKLCPCPASSCFLLLLPPNPTTSPKLSTWCFYKASCRCPHSREVMQHLAYVILLYLVFSKLIHGVTNWRITIFKTGQYSIICFLCLITHWCTWLLWIILLWT
jgi:hypothetical protein